MQRLFKLKIEMPSQKIFNKPIENVTLDEIHIQNFNTFSRLIDALWSREFAEHLPPGSNEMKVSLNEREREFLNDYHRKLANAPTTLALTTIIDDISNQALADYQKILERKDRRFSEEEKVKRAEKLIPWKEQLTQLFLYKQEKIVKNLHQPGRHIGKNNI